MSGQTDEEILKALLARASQHKKTEVSEFRLNIRAAQGKQIVLSKHWATKSTTFGQAKQWYIDQEGGDPSKIIFTANSKNWLDHHTMENAGIVDGKHLITIKFKVVGGAEQKDEERMIAVDNNLIDKTRITIKPDDFTLDDEKTLRYKMPPCGHIVSAKTMFMWIKTCFETKSYAFNEIICAVPDCGKEWDWKLCVAVANLTDQEFAKYHGIWETRHKKDLKLCPTCGAEIERPDDLTHFRIFHGNCPHYCYTCGGLWKAGGMQICGNSDCPNLTVQERLQNCEWHEIKNGELVVKVPNFRACPKCLTFMDKDIGCKDVKCAGCGEHFCFGCLKIGNHACGGGWGGCQGGIAPTQKLY